MKFLNIAIILSTAVIMTACKTTPEPVEELIEIAPPVLKTCTEISALTRVDIPAETKTFYATTEIANPPYEPIQRTEKQVRVIKEAHTIFVDSEGREVTDICETEIAPNADDVPAQIPGS
ncbi:MAG: hypothetical protein ABJ275_08145 [Maricaulaceae bacterium]